MANDLLKKIGFGGVRLISINVSPKKVVQGEEGKPLELEARIEPTLEEDTEKASTLLCKVKIGFGEQGPFEIDAQFRAYYRKKEAIQGQELLDAFDVVGFPVLSMISMFISQITNAMGFIPLILNPQQILQSPDDPSGKGD